MNPDENEIGEIKKLQREVAALQSFTGVAIATLATFVYAIIKVQGIYFFPTALFRVAIMFFGIVFFAINFTFFIIRAAEIAGVKLPALAKQIFSDWKALSLLNKILILLGLPSTMFSLWKMAQWIIIFVHA